MKHIQFNNLNSHNQELVRGKYEHISFDNQFIVYDKKDSNDIIVYGYYSIEPQRITDSRLYPTLLSANDKFIAQLMADKFNSVPCYCITQMEIDADIDKLILVEIFNYIAIQCVGDKPIVFVWKEHNGTVLFYPIIQDKSSYVGYPSMANYFADNF